MNRRTLGYFGFLGLLGFIGFSLFAKEPRNCSTFVFKTDSVLFMGHNLDETPGFHVPGIVCINKRNSYREGITWYELIADPEDYEKSLIPFDEKPFPKISWFSKYGSITFNSEGIDFPDGGINEEGLAIFEMSLGSTQHKNDESNPTLFISLWIQYQLDNCATLDEVIQNANDINLQGWSWHYFITDKNGDCAIIEFLEGGVVVQQGEDVKYPVLCNSQYTKELERLEKYQGFGGKVRTLIKKAPRFVRAVNILQGYDPSVHVSPRDYAMGLLEEIQIKGWNKWSILIDVNKMTLYFHTNRNRQLRYVSFDSFDFSEKPARLMDIHADLSGDMTSEFIGYTYERNFEHTKERAEHLFIERFKGLIDNGVTPEVYAKRFADYSDRMRDNNIK